MRFISKYFQEQYTSSESNYNRNYRGRPSSHNHLTLRVSFPKNEDSILKELEYSPIPTCICLSIPDFPHIGIAFKMSCFQSKIDHNNGTIKYILSYLNARYERY